MQLCQRAHERAQQSFTRLPGLANIPILGVLFKSRDRRKQKSELVVIVTPESITAAKHASQLTGVVGGQELARMFAWMRPNDLIWNYWVNNYLLGKSPPAFDILFWNSDTTRLPARLHHDYIDLGAGSPFVNANKLTLNGTPLDAPWISQPAIMAGGKLELVMGPAPSRWAMETGDKKKP